MSKSNGKVMRIKPITELVKFDFSVITARQFDELTRRSRGRDEISQFKHIIAAIASESSEIANAKDPATYGALHFDDYGALMVEFRRQKEAHMKAALENFSVEFSLEELTADGLDELQEAINKQLREPLAIARYMADYVVRTSREIGDLKSVDTYLDLPYYGEFSVIATELNNLWRATLENFTRKYIYQ